MIQLEGKRLPPIAGYSVLSVLLLISAAFGLFTGDVKIPIESLLNMLTIGPLGKTEDIFLQSVVWQIRFPRVLAAIISGAILAASGVAFQSALRNPLAEPYTLGVASGAAFGAACAIVAGLPFVNTAAFAGSLSTLFIVWVLGERKNDPDISRIILAGVIVSSILGAALTFLKALAGDKVSAIVIWLMGSFSAASWLDAMPMTLGLFVMLIFCVSNLNEMDIMASGANAASLGLNLSQRRIMILGSASFSVSFVVSRFGIIGFIGLVVPHILRILFGPEHRILIPLSLIGGGALLCAADAVAKSWNELPAGVLTVLIGGPVFCAILWNRS
ncbi:MAG: iron ABC transporter permease [Synergistaceae bacterium]|jgi:iron complex transport system permease protein|nr:iron ABC transporter permease [Synergistaceae bacterium]